MFDVKSFDVAAAATADADKYLIMSAQIALEVLRELKSPGCELLENGVL